MRIVFFRTPKPKRFEYKPLHFDPDQERRNQRRRELGLEVKGEADSFSSRIDSAWRVRYIKQREAKRKSRASAIIYLIIVAVLVYFIFFR